jgi:hypothetical protein
MSPSIEDWTDDRTKVAGIVFWHIVSSAHVHYSSLYINTLQGIKFTKHVSFYGHL